MRDCVLVASPTLLCGFASSFCGNGYSNQCFVCPLRKIILSEILTYILIVGIYLFVKKILLCDLG